MDERDETAVGTLYDWWSRHPRVLEALYEIAFFGREAEIRGDSIGMLAPQPGERVVEVGCGNGNSFQAIRDGIDPQGALVGVDMSRGMVRSARARIRDRGWQNVQVVHGDAERPPFEAESFDGAYAAMSLSAMPDPVRTIDATKRLLRPGGRFVVLDARPFGQSPWSLLNRIVVPVAEYATNWVPQVDIEAHLRQSFDRVEVSTFNAGSMFVVRATKAPSA